jgi:hypothetical protein
LQERPTTVDVAPDLITREVVLELLDAEGFGTALGVRLVYDVRDPYAAVAEFHVAEGAVRWVFARELLCEGMFEPTGDGDVHVWPSVDKCGSAVMIVELSSAEGDALLQVATKDVFEFLRSTETAVPLGSEGALIDVDAALTQLFG